MVLYFHISLENEGFCILTATPLHLRLRVLQCSSKSKVKTYPGKRPRKPLGSWDVEDPTFFRQLAQQARSWEYRGIMVSGEIVGFTCQPRSTPQELPPPLLLVLISVRG
jgi:hypothetical protein